MAIDVRFAVTMSSSSAQHAGHHEVAALEIGVEPDTHPSFERWRAAQATLTGEREVELPDEALQVRQGDTG
jgi:hypothetical protein